MKIRTRLAIAFVTITVVPIVLIFVAAFGLVNYQEHLFQKTYGLSEQIDLLSGNQESRRRSARRSGKIQIYLKNRLI